MFVSFNSKKYLIVLKAEVNKLVIGKLLNVPSGLNSLKKKGDDLNAEKLKNVHVGLTKLSVVVDKVVAKRQNLID